jgi:hypothetical protein
VLFARLSGFVRKRAEREVKNRLFVEMAHGAATAAYPVQYRFGQDSADASD